MALSKDTNFRLEHALTKKSAADEMAAAVDASTDLTATNATDIATNVTDIATNVTDIATNVTDIATNAAKVLGSNLVIAGILIATATDNTDAATLGFLVGDTIALIKDADQTLQTVTDDDQFAVAPAIGDLILQLRSV